MESRKGKRGCRCFPLMVLLVLSMVMLSACGAEQGSSPNQLNDQNPVPASLLSNELNVFSDVSFPEGYHIYAVEYSIDAEGMDYYFFTLYLTAKGKPEEIITYLSNLVGDGGEEKTSQYINSYNKDGRVGIDGILRGTEMEVACKILPTTQDSYDYDYVEGCDIKLQAVLRDTNQAYNDIFENSYNVNAMEELSGYFDLSKITGKKSVYVRTLQGSSQITAVYNVENLQEVADLIKTEVKCKAMPEEPYIITLLDYGEISVSLFMDINNNAISVFQTQRDSTKSYGDYEIEQSAIVDLGFMPDQDNGDGRYIYRDNSGDLWVSVSVAQLGGEGDEVLFFKKLDKYDLAIWYYPEEQVFWVQVNNQDTEAKYAYHVSDGSVSDEWSNNGAVEAIFKEALANENTEDVYLGPLAIFSNYVNNTFGMSIDDLFQTAAL